MQTDNKNPAWRGIIVVANTPFDGDGAVDYDSIARFADYISASGCPAVLLRGVAAETSFLEASERPRLMGEFAAQAQGRFDIIAGLAEVDGVKLAKEAEAALAAGATAVNWRPPPGIPASRLIATLTGIAAAGAQPIMLQDFELNGAGLPVESILAALDAVAALTALKLEIADSVGKAAAIAPRLTRPVDIFGGWPVTGLIAALDAGLHGYMPTSLSPLMQHIYREHHNGRRDTAVALFSQLKPLYTFMTRSLGRSIAINKLLRLHEGVFRTSYCRHPEAVLTADELIQAEVLITAALDLQNNTVTSGWSSP